VGGGGGADQARLFVSFFGLRQRVFPRAVFWLDHRDAIGHQGRRKTWVWLGLLWQCVVSKGATLGHAKMNEKAFNLIFARVHFICPLSIAPFLFAFVICLRPKWLLHGAGPKRRLHGAAPWIQCSAACATCVGCEVACRQQPAGSDSGVVELAEVTQLRLASKKRRK
jgi:hypothetical protein